MRDGAGRCRRVRLRREQRCDDADRHQHAEADEHHVPRRVVAENERARGRDDRRNAVGRNGRGAARALLRRQEIGAVRVADEVLARGEEHHREREAANPAEHRARLEESERADREQEEDLREDHPTAAPPEERSEYRSTNGAQRNLKLYGRSSHDVSPIIARLTSDCSSHAGIVVFGIWFGRPDAKPRPIISASRGLEKASQKDGLRGVFSSLFRIARSSDSTPRRCDRLRSDRSRGRREPALDLRRRMPCARRSPRPGRGRSGRR